MNVAIEDGRIGELGIVVLDELHMIDEENRGYIMELMITKLLVLQQDIQLVGMSATLSVRPMSKRGLLAKCFPES